MSRKSSPSSANRRTPQCELGSALRHSFALNLRQLRMQQGLTQVELASAAGVGRTFISQLERGHFSVTLETIGALATALNVCPTKLIQAADQRRDARIKDPIPITGP